MAKKFQYLLAFVCVSLLLSFQNCAQPISLDGESTLESGNSSSSSMGNYYLDVIGPIDVGPSDTSVRIYGICSPGKSEQNYIQWHLYSGSGVTTGLSGNCYNQYYDINIPLSSGFNYQASNRIALTYVVIDDGGNEYQRTYSVDLAEGVVGTVTSETPIECGDFSLGSGSTIKECDLSGALTRTTRGYGGLAIKARVSVGSEISSRSAFYALFNLTDVSYSPFFTYGTGRNDNESKYTFERLQYGTSNFTTYNNIWASSTGKLFQMENGKETSDFLWLNTSSYDIELRFSVAPVSQGTSLVIMKICPAGSTNNCITQSTLTGSNGRSTAYIKKAFGLNGLKLVFGMPSGISSYIDGEWINPSNWTINNVRVKLCGSDHLTPEYVNDGYCEF